MSEDPKEKLEFFYRRFYKGLLEAAKELVKDENTAKDMVHDAFEVSVKYLDRMDTERIEQAYWYYQAILKSRCGEYFRRSRKFLLFGELYDVQEIRRVFGSFQENADTDPVEILEINERREATRRVLKELSQKEQEVIHLYYTENLTYRQIAERYGTSTDMIGVILYRAKRKMERRLKKDR